MDSRSGERRRAAVMAARTSGARGVRGQSSPPSRASMSLMRAMIVTDELGVFHESRFESLAEARRAWGALPFQYASVLFVLLPNGMWEAVKVYGLPLTVSNIVRRQTEQHALASSASEPPPSNPESSSLKATAKAKHVTARRASNSTQQLVIELSSDGWQAVEVGTRCLLALGQALSARDAYLNANPHIDALLRTLGGGGDEKIEDAAREMLELLGANAFSAPKVAAWLDARREHAPLFASLPPEGGDTLDAASIDVDAVRVLIATGCPTASTELSTRDATAFFAVEVALPAHGISLRGPTARFAHFASLPSSLAENDAWALRSLPSFPRRHMRSKLQKLGAGLGDKQLRNRNNGLSLFLDELVDIYPTLSSDSQLALAKWLATKPSAAAVASHSLPPPPPLPQPRAENTDKTRDQLQPLERSSEDEPERQSGHEAPTTSVPEEHDVPPPVGDEVRRSESSTLDAMRSSITARMASVAEAAYVISKEIKARRDRHEVDQHVLIFQLRGIRGMTERHTRLSEANARIYVSARVLDDYEDEEVRGEEEEEEDDDAEDVARDEEAPARVERERIPVYRSDERFMSLNPTWDPPHKFTVFLGKEKRDKRLLVGVHDASKASSSDDDTTSIFYYAVLSNLEEFASNAPSVRSSVSSSGLESMLKPVELSLVDDENSKTEAKLIGEAWLATSAQVQQLDVLRRHCVLIYEHRVFQNFVEAFGVGWFMCMCQCDPDFAEPLHEYNNGSDRTTAQWRHYHACVPDDIQRPLSHVPDKDRLGQNHQPPPSFDALSPLLPGERVVKSWHMCRTDAEDVSGWAYATSIASSFWYPSPPPTAIYRRCAWFRYTTTAPRTNTDRV